MGEYSNRIKLKVLKSSLRLEKTASYSLAFILGINDPENSKSLGNKTSSLSFNQKLNLLLDSGSITKTDKLKLEIFMEVRNQFMHNLDVYSFKEVFQLLEGREKKLKKIYPIFFSDSIDIEKSFEECITKIYSEGISCFASFKGERLRKFRSLNG